MELMTLEELIGGIDGSCLPDPTLYTYYKFLTKRQIVINNEIGDDILEMATLPYMEMSSDGSGKPIEIILATPGGDMFQGFNLIDQIDNTNTPTIIHIMSTAMSMGILIAMAGKNNPNVKTVCHPFSVGLLHDGSYYLEGTKHEVKDFFNFTQAYEEKIKRYILSHSKIDETQYEKMERTELWLDAEGMLKLGIVDEII